nr:hypothetical protein [Tanacetum cinerariifolium]
PRPRRRHRIERAKRLPKSHVISVMADEAAVGPYLDDVDRAHPRRRRSYVGEVGPHLLFIRNGNVEAGQVGVPRQQGRQLVGRR